MNRGGVFLLLSALVVCLHAQSKPELAEPVRISSAITPPRVIRKIEPDYTKEAIAGHVQGSVLLQIVIGADGKARDITVISPVGYGLDERAEAAVAEWEFAPATRNGKPIAVMADAEVTFRLLGLAYDQKTEAQRKRFNLAIQALNAYNPLPAKLNEAVESIHDLSKHKFVPAICLEGFWKINGEHGPKDVPAGLELMQKAAAKSYAPALYAIALRRIDGRDLPRDAEKGFQEMREAATMGSAEAQYYLAVRYAAGNGVPQDSDRARRYFRLCAAQGEALCQYRLARLLYNAPDRRERDYLQAIALFQLAADRVPEAKQVASNEAGKLTAEQSLWVGTLKGQIVRK